MLVMPARSFGFLVLFTNNTVGVKCRKLRSTSLEFDKRFLDRGRISQSPKPFLALDENIIVLSSVSHSPVALGAREQIFSLLYYSVRCELLCADGSALERHYDV